MVGLLHVLLVSSEMAKGFTISLRFTCEGKQAVELLHSTNAKPEVIQKGGWGVSG